MNGKKDFPKEARDNGEKLLIILKEIKKKINRLYPHGLSQSEIENVKKIIANGYSLSLNCRNICKETIEKEHGKGKATSVGFKQFMQEYMVSFPTRHYDTANEIYSMLLKTMEWLENPISLLPNSSSMLLSGPQGIGKTHSICDAAVVRHKLGLKSIILMGHQFSNEELWTQIKKLLGFSNSISREELLDILNSAGETSGKPLIIFIDAINETEPKDIWKKHLCGFIEQINRYKWIKLCLSCRSIFIGKIIPEQLKLLQIEHRGFEGVEFDACFEFFRSYNLDAPSMLLMQPEYFNPLFLKLVCESLQETNQKKLPSGIVGFSKIVEFFFFAKNKKLAERLDYSEKENHVYEDMNIIVEKMCESKKNWLEREVAKKIIEAKNPNVKWSDSPFNHLLIEGLIKEGREYDYESREIIDVISVGFERLGDYLIVKKYLANVKGLKELQKIFQVGGELYFLAENTSLIYENKNIIEALAIQIPEKYGVEIDEIVNSESRIIRKAIIDSLQWRSSDSITHKIELFFEDAIKNGNTRNFIEVADSLLSISTIENHPLNASWLHNIISELDLIVRDGKLSPFLHISFGKYKTVDRLMRWGLKADLENIPQSTIKLWLTILAWFSSSSDRRVRDHSTKAMVRIGEKNPEIWSEIINNFNGIDDDYVIERCLAASYGSLLRNPNLQALEKVSNVVYKHFFQNGLKYKNALIIDYARLIIDLAKHNSMAKDIKKEKYQPPYLGKEKIEWPSKEYVEKYKDTPRELPKLYWSCMNDDFQHYTVPGVVRMYEEEDVNVLDACRWILKHVLDMGYTEDSEIAQFDKYLLGKYGGGRSRPEWAERVGKKYQWIALYRLAARLAIKYPEKKDDLLLSYSDKPLLIESKRNIDPSILNKSCKSVNKNNWWTPIEYNYTNHKIESEIEWLKKIDFPDSIEMIQPNDKWFVLYCNYGWDYLNQKSKEGYPKRNMWIHMRSLMVRNEDKNECWNWLKKQNFMGEWMPKGYDMHDGFLGEYPWGVPFDYLYNREEENFYDNKKPPCELFPTNNNLNIHYSFDAYQKESINFTLPSEKFFLKNGLTWNLNGGYIDETGKKIFFDPATEEGGRSALLVKKDFLVDYLKKNNLSIVWTILSEKIIISGFSRQSPGYTDYSRAYMLEDNGKIKASAPVINNVINKKDK